MRIRTMRCLVYVLLSLATVSSVNAGDWTLVKTSTKGQSAVLRNPDNALVLVKVGDRLEDGWKVVGIGNNKVVMEKRDLKGKITKVLANKSE